MFIEYDPKWKDEVNGVNRGKVRTPFQYSERLGVMRNHTTLDCNLLTILCRLYRMSGLEDLRAKQADIMNWLRDAEAELAALQSQTAEMIGDIEARKCKIESVYELLRGIEDEILRLS